jgi:hypothetical protein
MVGVEVEAAAGSGARVIWEEHQKMQLQYSLSLIYCNCFYTTCIRTT